MSHFTVLVINTKGKNDVDEQLAPFDESLVCEPTKVLVTDKDIDVFVNHFKNKSQNGELDGLTPKEIYDIHGGEWWDGGEWIFQDNGEVIYYSKYNQNARWDWYQLGGRWAGSLKLKEEVSEEYKISPGFSWGWKEGDKLAVISQRGVDQAKACDIDWEEMRDPFKFDNACRFWELKVDGDKPRNKEEEKQLKMSYYKTEYYEEVYGDKITYAKCVTNFSTYAVLKDGKWIAPGNMGWFGISDESPEEQRKWELEFYDLIIKDLPPNSLITVVDCHI